MRAAPPLGRCRFQVALILLLWACLALVYALVHVTVAAWPGAACANVRPFAVVKAIVVAPYVQARRIAVSAGLLEQACMPVMCNGP